MIGERERKRKREDESKKKKIRKMKIKKRYKKRSLNIIIKLIINFKIVEIISHIAKLPYK